jgi:hypothetical protein
MIEHTESEAQPHVTSRRRAILGAVLALCGVNVGTDAQGAFAGSPRTPPHQQIEWNAPPPGPLPSRHSMC